MQVNISPPLSFLSHSLTLQSLMYNVLGAHNMSNTQKTTQNQSFPDELELDSKTEPVRQLLIEICESILGVILFLLVLLRIEYFFF